MANRSTSWSLLMYAHFRMFKSSVKTWETMMNEASSFASTLGEQRLISIAHNCDSGTALIVVWYWDKGIPPNQIDSMQSKPI